MDNRRERVMVDVPRGTFVVGSSSSCRFLPMNKFMGWGGGWPPTTEVVGWRYVNIKEPLHFIVGFCKFGDHFAFYIHCNYHPFVRNLFFHFKYVVLWLIQKYEFGCT